MYLDATYISIQLSHYRGAVKQDTYLQNSTFNRIDTQNYLMVWPFYQSKHKQKSKPKPLQLKTVRSEILLLAKDGYTFSPASCDCHPSRKESFTFCCPCVSHSAVSNFPLPTPASGLTGKAAKRQNNSQDWDTQQSRHVFHKQVAFSFFSRPQVS